MTDGFVTGPKSARAIVRNSVTFCGRNFPAAVSERPENKHRHHATAANPFAFTNRGTVNPPELDFARNRKQLRQQASRGEFYANFIGMS